MKRRNFLQLSSVVLGAIAVPFKLFGNSYTKPIYKPANFVGPMHKAQTIHMWNMCVKESFDGLDNQYVRFVEMLKAAENVSKKDIVNEFYQKYYDNNALLTTCAAEGDYHVNQKFEHTFRKHLTVGQVKEIIDWMKGKAKQSKNPEARKNSYNIERFADEMIEGRVVDHKYSDQPYAYKNAVKKLQDEYGIFATKEGKA